MLGAQIHRYIFLFGICTLGGGMLLGEAPTSIAEVILFVNWLLEGNFKEKFSGLKRNKLFWLVSSLFLLHLSGLLHTDSYYSKDFKNAWDDIRVKIPLQLLPLIFFSTKPLSKKEFYLLLNIFVVGILLSSFWCLFYSYKHEINDPREISRFISHIRFGLLINMGISSLVYLAFHERSNIVKCIHYILALYLILFMIKISLVTGIVLCSILALVFVVYLVLHQAVIIKTISLVVFLVVVVLSIVFIKNEWKSFSYVDPSPLNTPQLKTKMGNEYYQVGKNRHTENGYYIAYNIQYDELDTMWHRRSKVYIYSKDAKGNELAGNLIRYLSSKGLTKDSVGIYSLTNEDIKNVENGATNYKYVNAPAYSKRLYELFWEYEDYREGKNPSGNTMLMRLEFWKTAMYIIKNNLIFGVGTGDDWKAFEEAYKETNSPLTNEWRLKSHNQFLAVGVSFGVTGLSLFIFFLFYPLIKYRKQLNKLYFLFFIIAFISFLTEDTLESQTGATFFAYFNTLFLWLVTDKNNNTLSEN